jgi:hypothetical protein
MEKPTGQIVIEYGWQAASLSIEFVIRCNDKAFPGTAAAPLIHGFSTLQSACWIDCRPLFGRQLPSRIARWS